MQRLGSIKVSFVTFLERVWHVCVGSLQCTCVFYFSLGGIFVFFILTLCLVMTQIYFLRVMGLHLKITPNAQEPTYMNYIPSGFCCQIDWGNSSVILEKPSIFDVFGIKHFQVIVIEGLQGTVNL